MSHLPRLTGSPAGGYIPLVRPNVLPPPPAPLEPVERPRLGRFYTPSALVRALHRLLAEALGKSGLPPRQCVLVDPLCGAGAFLGAPDARSYRARLGLDADPRALDEARHGAPGADLLVGNPFGEGLDGLSARVISGGPVAVIGGPSATATSKLLQSRRHPQLAEAVLPFARGGARGAGIDDHVLFFAAADHLIEAGGGQGAIAFVTNAAFIDDYLYSPLRRWLLSRYRLHALVDLGAGLFEGTRTATSLSVWARQPGGHADAPFGHLRLSGTRQERLRRIEGDVILAPAYPCGEAALLNAPSAQTTRELAAMRAVGAPVTSLFGSSLPGLKTRLDELLADANRAALEQRMRDFFSARKPEAFARKHALPDTSLKRLTDAFAQRSATRFSSSAIRRLARFGGAPDRFRMRKGAMAWVYLDPELIPKAGHRFCGFHDPHRLGPKLVFNVRELPLAASVIEANACVQDRPHSFFAPLRVPAAFLDPTAQGIRGQAKATLNLSPAWMDAAALLNAPEDLLYFASGIINSRVTQERFAPFVGTSEEPLIPRLNKQNSRLAQRIADSARKCEPGGPLSAGVEKLVATLFRLD